MRRMDLHAAVKPTASHGAKPPALLQPKRGQRSDGAEAREQLLLAALKLFADKGFAKTSTREIASAARANVAAISYYFGDKAGLYRAVFTQPMCNVSNLDAQIHSGRDLGQALTAFYESFIEPLKQGELMQLCTRLRFREMVEPTGLWAEELDKDIKPAHAALVDALARHLNLSEADDDLHRLAFAIAGLAVQIFVGRDIIQSVRPQLLGGPELTDLWGQRLVGYALAMVESEGKRRAQLPGTPEGAHS